MTMTESFKKLFGVVDAIRAGEITMNEGRKIMGLDPLPSSNYREGPGDFTMALVKERVDDMKVKYKCLKCDWRFMTNGQKDGITCLACGGPTIAVGPNEDDRPGVRPPSMFKIPQDTSMKIQYLDRLITLATNYELSSELQSEYAARAVKVCDSIEEDLDIRKDEEHVEI